MTIGATGLDLRESSAATALRPGSRMPDAGPGTRWRSAWEREMEAWAVSAWFPGALPVATWTHQDMAAPAASNAELARDRHVFRTASAPVVDARSIGAPSGPRCAPAPAQTSGSQSGRSAPNELVTRVASGSTGSQPITSGARWRGAIAAGPDSGPSACAALLLDRATPRPDASLLAARGLTPGSTATALSRITAWSAPAIDTTGAPSDRSAMEVVTVAESLRRVTAQPSTNHVQPQALFMTQGAASAAPVAVHASRSAPSTAVTSTLNLITTTVGPLTMQSTPPAWLGASADPSPEPTPTGPARMLGGSAPSLVPTESQAPASAEPAGLAGGLSGASGDRSASASTPADGPAIHRLIEHSLAAHAPLRLHIQLRGSCAQVWIGTDGRRDVAALIQSVQTTLRRQGLTLTTLTCNGKCVHGVDADLGAAPRLPTVKEP